MKFAIFCFVAVYICLSANVFAGGVESCSQNVKKRCTSCHTIVNVCKHEGEKDDFWSGKMAWHSRVVKGFDKKVTDSEQKKIVECVTQPDVLKDMCK